MALSNFLLHVPDHALNVLSIPNHGSIIRKVRLIDSWLKISRRWKILLILSLQYRYKYQENYFFSFISTKFIRIAKLKMVKIEN